MAKKQNIERKVEDMATICLLTKSSPKPAAGGLHFALIQEEKVLFPLSRGEKNVFPLTNLNCKMAQAVQQTSRLGTGPRRDMVC